MKYLVFTKNTLIREYVPSNNENKRDYFINILIGRQGGDEREIEQGKKEKEEDEQKVKEAEEKRKEHKLSEEYLTPCEAFR